MNPPVSSAVKNQALNQSITASSPYFHQTKSGCKDIDPLWRMKNVCGHFKEQN